MFKLVCAVLRKVFSLSNEALDTGNTIETKSLSKNWANEEKEDFCLNEIMMPSGFYHLLFAKSGNKSFRLSFFFFL